MIGINTKHVHALMQRLASMRGQATFTAVQKANQFVAGEIRRQILAWTSTTGGRKSGALARSYRPTFYEKGDRIVGGVFSDSVYARIHEFGGPIIPKNVQWLTIPLTTTAERVGARNFPGKLFFIGGGKIGSPLSRGPFLATAGGGRGSRNGIIPIYLLRKRVYITAKHYLAKAAKASKDRVTEILAQAVRRTIKGASNG
jgi:phage gpG-like protein